MKELALPPPCTEDPNCVELLSVWHSANKYVMSIRFNFFEENGVNETVAWGQVLADTADRLLANSQTSHSLTKVLELVRRELDKPTTCRDGGFSSSSDV
jgi:hypothetical protein